MDISIRVEPDASSGLKSNHEIGFLDLPGELRDIIYLFVAACSKDGPCSNPNTRVKLKHIKDYHNNVEWHRLQRQDLGLAQTCRQVRSEYLPIYAAHTNLYLCMRNFALAVEDLNITKRGIVMPVGDVVIGVQNWDGEDAWRTNRSCVDIAPLLTLHLRQPELLFRFDDAECMRERLRRNEQLDTSTYFATLFSLHTNPLWRSFFTMAVREVFVYPDLDWICARHVKVHIEIEKEFGEIWMRSHTARRNRRRGKMDGWLAAVGLEGLMGWNGLRVYWARGWFEELFGN